jgi:general secretion pathway protein C
MWTFALWVLIAGSVVYWGLRLFAQPEPAPAHAVLAQDNSVARGDLLRLLGTPAEPVVVEPEPVPVARPDARFALLGVVSPQADRSQAGGVALIAIDGQPARAYRVGGPVEGDTVLLSVHPRGARLGPRGGEPTIALDLPPPTAAATGVPAGFGGPGGAPVPTRFVPPPRPPGSAAPMVMPQSAPPPEASYNDAAHSDTVGDPMPLR